MATIDPTAQLASLIRAQVASLRQARGMGPRARPSRQEASVEANDAGDLPAIVAKRIRGIDAGDPDRERKALRMFLEAVLLSELGAALVNDPAFVTMVDHVQASMEADPQLAAASRDAARILLSAALT